MLFEFVSCFVLRISDLHHCASDLAPFQGASWGLRLSRRSVHCNLVLGIWNFAFWWACF